LRSPLGSTHSSAHFRGKRPTGRREFDPTPGLGLARAVVAAVGRVAPGLIAVAVPAILRQAGASKRRLGYADMTKLTFGLTEPSAPKTVAPPPLN
jgi:hypothetical protein